jgi:hypothetical protein
VKILALSMAMCEEFALQRVFNSSFGLLPRVYKDYKIRLIKASFFLVCGLLKVI